MLSLNLFNTGKNNKLCSAAVFSIKSLKVVIVGLADV
jgi:hypothetical protein